MKFIVEQHRDGFLAYPLGLKGVVIGQGDTRDAALAEVKSATKYHREIFGSELLDNATDIIDAELVDAAIDP